MPTRRLVVAFAVAAASGCSGDVTGPAGALRFRMEFLGSTEIIPGERLAARVDASNPTGVGVVFRGCPPWVQLVREGGPLPEVPARAWDCPDGRYEIPPGGSLTDTVVWSGQDLAPADNGGGRERLTNLPAGTYRVRPVLRDADRIRARGDWHGVVIRPWAPVRLVNTIGREGPVDLEIAGRMVAAGLAAGQTSGTAVAAAGPQVAVVRRSGEATTILTSPLALEDGSAHLFAIRRTGGGWELWDVPDGGPVTTPDRTNLRIIHLAESASAIELRAVSPGGAAPQIVSPFAYGSVTAYLSGNTGPWRLTVVTAESGDTLLATAPMPVPGGATRTLILLDSPAGAMWATLVTASQAEGR
jgi:hypothetical protein